MCLNLPVFICSHQKKKRKQKIMNTVTELFLNILKLHYKIHKAYLPCVPWETKKRQWYKKIISHEILVSLKINFQAKVIYNR